jgi:exodeoxyribonuclease V alpha subunit
VLKDLITISPQVSGLRSQVSLPVTRLQFVYRQGKESAIVTTAHAINEGVSSPPPVVNEVAKAQAWSDLNFIAASGADDCLAKVIELCTTFIPQHFKWFNPVTDVQVLAPMHKGVAGVANLNNSLQAALNGSTSLTAGGHSKGIKTVSGEYRPGDKLIQLRNNYDKNLFNGDIGTVVSVDLQKGTLVADFDGSKHAFERGEFGDVALAYAISIHKSQGSEYPVVIIPLLKGHFMMLQRNLIYTAITRGRKKVFVVGEPAAYGMAVRNAESKFRHTHLKEKILAGSL